jgi:ABC-type branched-subunit amino acid transport system substrate-binding protein
VAEGEQRGNPAAALTALRDWLIEQREPALAARCDGYLSQVPAGATAVLTGPTGERNTYSLGPRGTVLCVAATPSGARAQFAAVLATGNRALFAGSAGEALVAALPAALKGHAAVRKQADAPFDAVLFEGDSDELQTLVKDVAQRRADRVGAGRVGGRVRERRRGRLRARAAADRALGQREHGRGGRQCEFDDDRLTILAVRIKQREWQGDPEAAPFTLVPRRCYATHDEKAGRRDVRRRHVACGDGPCGRREDRLRRADDGRQAHYGKDMQNGIVLALEDFNATNPKIGGKPVKFVLETQDDQADPRTGTTVAQKLVDDGIKGMLGHFNSGTTIPASRIYANAGIPQIAMATAPEYTQQGSRRPSA